MTQQGEPVAAPILKAVSAWAAVGVTSWAEAASFLAFVYTLGLLCEWWWKRFWKPFFQKRGWIKHNLRRYDDRVKLADAVKTVEEDRAAGE